MISDYVENKRLRVIIKAGSHENKVLGFDEKKKALRIAIKEPADKNKANKELVKFLSKELGKKVLIKTGSTSKEKVLEVLD